MKTSLKPSKRLPSRRTVERQLLDAIEGLLLRLDEGFVLLEQQKRIPVGKRFHRLDLLFRHRSLRRLIAVELKTGTVKRIYVQRMAYHLHWLNSHERRKGDGSPIGIIVCAGEKRVIVRYVDRTNPENDAASIAKLPTGLVQRELKKALASSGVTPAPEVRGWRGRRTAGVESLA